MLTTSKRTLTVGVATIAVFAVAATTTYALLSESPPVQLGQPSTPPDPAPQATTVDPVLRDHFAVLRSDRAPIDPSQFEKTVSPGSGLNWGLARQTNTSDGSPVAVVPGSKGICVRFADGSIPCGSVADSLNGHLMQVGFCLGASGEGASVQGLAVDGVDSVRISTAGGNTATAQVTDNVYRAELSGPPASVSYTDGTGEHTRAIPAAAASCAM